MLWLSILVSWLILVFLPFGWKTKMLATLGDWFGTNMISMLVKSTCRRSRGSVATMGHKGAFGEPPSYWRQHVQALIDCFIWLTIPGHQNILVVRIGYSHSLGVLHLYDTHSKWQSNVPLAPRRVVDPHSPLWAWSIDRGHSGES